VATLWCRVGKSTNTSALAADKFNGLNTF